ncbi:hypothetical protein HZA55_05955 [Candidatus Poribacteria bacterium]|nr:hypothetical protein [Candidatus Poribacteria bacterium]
MKIKYLFLYLILGLFLLGCNNNKDNNIKFETEYQMVLLSNGQVYFGKLENINSPYPILKDVFYVQSIANKETNEVSSILVKRGNEWHSPDLMYLNSKQIIMIEPVTANSRVEQLIKEAKSKNK